MRKNISVDNIDIAGSVTSPLRMRNGSATTPSIAFATEPSLGIYRYSEGVIGVSSTLSDGRFARIDTGGDNFPTDLAVNGNSFVVMPSVGQVSKKSSFEIGQTDGSGVQQYMLALSEDRISTTATGFRLMNAAQDEYINMTVGTSGDNDGLVIQRAATGANASIIVMNTSAGAAMRKVDKNAWWQGSFKKTIVDNEASTFAGMVLASTAGANYAGGRIDFTIFGKDAANQAVQSGFVLFACHNIAGTITATFGSPSTVTHSDGTASFDAPVFTAAQTDNYIDFQVQSNCTGITATTLTIEVTFTIQVFTDLRAW